MPLNTKEEHLVSSKELFTIANPITEHPSQISLHGKLPSYVMFKRKRLPKDKFPAGVIVRAQKGWMDEGLVVMTMFLHASFST